MARQSSCRSTHPFSSSQSLPNKKQDGVPKLCSPVKNRQNSPGLEAHVFSPQLILSSRVLIMKHHPHTLCPR